jgi:ubiquitin C-terminal hydrolase
LGNGDILSNISLNSPILLPFNTLSHDFDLREKLEKSVSKIDILDNKSWYLGTVMEVETRKRTGKEYKWIKYGLRRYHLEAKNQDSKQRTFFGFGEPFDKEVSAHDPKIRIVHTFSKPIIHWEALNKYPTDNKKFNEVETYFPHVIGEKKFYAVGCRSDKEIDLNYINLINNFGELGGFVKFLDILENLNQHKPQQYFENPNYEKINSLIFIITEIVFNIHTYLHTEFTKNFIKLFIAKIFDYFRNFSVNNENRNFKKEKIESTFKKIKEIMGKVYIETDLNWEYETFCLDFCITCLNSPTLKKRLVGLKILTEIIQEISRNLPAIYSSSSSMTSSYEAHLPNQKLIETLRNANLLEIIYGSNSHLQLVEKSSDLFKALINARLFHEEEISRFYTLYKESTDINMNMAIYKILKENMYPLGTNNQKFLLRLMLDNSLDLAKNNFKNFNKNDSKGLKRDLELILALHQKLPSYESGLFNVEIGNYFYNLLFNTEISESSGNNEIILWDEEFFDNIMNETISLVRSWDFKEHRIIFIEKIFKRLKEGKDFTKTLIVLRRLLSGVSANLEEFQRNKIYFLMLDDYDIINCMINYMQNNPEIVNISNQQEKDYLNSQKKIDLKINEFFSFINFIISSANRKIIFKIEQILVLYFIFVENNGNLVEVSKIIPSSNNCMNKFFKFLCIADEKKMLPQHTFKLIFTKMVENKNLNLDNIDLELIKILWGIFLNVNRENKKLEYFDKGKSTGSSNMINFQFNSNNKTNSSLHTVSFNHEDLATIKILTSSPLELEGFNLIYKAVICTSSSILNIKDGISKICILNFIQLFKCTDKSSEERGRIWFDLLKKVIEDINLFKNNFIESTANSIPFRLDFFTENKILNCISLLRALVEESEKFGTAGVIPHSSINKYNILSLKVMNKFEGFNSKDYLNFEIKVSSNTTVWDLRRLLSKKLKTLPELINISFMENSDSNNNKDIKDIKEKIINEDENGKILSDLKFKDQDEIIIKKNIVLENKTREALVDSDGNLTIKFQEILEHIFYKFASHKKEPGEENNGKIKNVSNNEDVKMQSSENFENLYMDTSDCAKFIKYATNLEEEYEISPEDPRVLIFFMKYDKDQDGLLSLQDFLDFYLDQYNNKKPHIIWENLKHFGYRSDFKHINEPYEQYNSNKNYMPRYVLAKELNFFNTIFSLHEIKGSETLLKESAKLLNFISTNPVVLRNILFLERIEKEEDWAIYIGGDGDYYKQLYCLQIIESFFEEFESPFTEVDNEPIEFSVLEEKDLILLPKDYKILWLESFLVHGGFNNILQLFFSSDITKSENSDKNILIKKCMNLLIKIIRNSLLLILNTSKNIGQEKSIISEESERENVIRCIRKESISPENALIFEKEEGKNIHNFQLNKNLSHCDGISQYFTQKYKNNLITSLLDGDSHVKNILSKILKLIKAIILKNETDNEERIFISTANNLFSLLYVSQNDIFKITQILFSSNTEFDYKNIIVQGLLINPHLLVRANFYKTLKNLSQNLYNLKEYNFITNLINIVHDKIFSLNTLTEMKNSKYLFALEENLVSLSYNNRFIQDNLNIKFPEVALKIFSILHDSENLEESVLSGYLKLISTLVDLDSKLKNLLGEKNLIKILINKFMLKETINDQEKFMSLIGDMGTHKKYIELYTGNGDYQQNHNFINNSNQSEEIRNNIFNLITKLCENNLDNLIQLFNTKLSEIPFTEEIKNKKKINSYNPIAERRSSCGYVGIKNLGCICYMNAMLQQFFLIPSFKFSLLQIDDKKNFTFSEENKDIDDNLLHQLQKMFTFLELSDRVSYNPSDFCFAFKDFTGRRTNLTQQQDAQEFLGRIFDLLEFGIKSTENKYLLQSVFGGKTCSQLECKECGTKKRNYEDFFNLSLEVKNMKTVKNSLDKFISEEKIEGYFCDTCKKNTTCSKKNTLAQLPNILIMHLQRIGYNYDTGLNEKDNSRLEFPEVLNLKQYSIEENDYDKRKNKSDEKNKLLQSQENASDFIYEREEEYYEYILVGVVLHIGHADAGHYISYINTNRNGKDSTLTRSNSNWLTFNDAYVSLFDFSSLEENCFGGNHDFSKTGFIGPVPAPAPPQFNQEFVSSNASHGYANNYSGRTLADNLSPANNQNGYASPSFKEAESGQSAYMLVYERVKKNPIKLVKSKNEVEEIINKNKEIKLIEISEENNFKIMKSLDIFKKLENTSNCSFDDKNLTIFNTLIFDTIKKEYLQYVPFYEIPKCVPYNYYLDVINDNIEFYNDQKIFNNNFNQFLENLLSIIENLLINCEDDSYSSCELSYQNKNNLLENNDLNKHKKMNSINHIIEVILSYIFEVISKSYFKNSLTGIISKLNTLMKSMPIISNSVLNYLNSRKELLTDILFTTDESVNTGYKNLIITAIRSNLNIQVGELPDPHQSQSQPALTLLDNLIDFLPTEASKLWTKILSYLELFEDLVITKDFLIINYFMNKNLIAKLIDFFLGKESPFYDKTQNRNEMGKSGVNAKFAPLISTISHLLTISIQNNNPDQLSVKEKLNQYLNEDIEMNISSRNIHNQSKNLSYQPISLNQQTELDLIALNDKKFYLNAFKENYNNAALSKILAYMMKNNYDFSKLSIFWILEAINKNTTLQDAKNSFDLISEIIKIEDEYQLTRFEWLFGIPHIIINFNTGSTPTMPINVSRHGDKLFKYVSHPILYCNNSYDSLTERMFYKFFSSADYLQIINLFITNILFPCPKALIYFDSLPHPRPSSQNHTPNSKAIDHLFELAKEEIGRYNNSTYSSSKNNEHLISQFEANRVKYENLINEIKQPQGVNNNYQINENISSSLVSKTFPQERLDMLNKMWDHTYRKGMIYSDVIYICDHFQRKEDKDSLNEMISKDLYLICIDMETDVGVGQENHPLSDEKLSSEEKEKVLQANNKSTYQAKFMNNNNNSSTLFSGWNNKNSSSTHTSVKNVYYEPPQDGIDIIPTQFYLNKSEDELYKNLCQGKLKLGLKYRRVLKSYKPENVIIRNTFRRYILYNPTEFDYKVKIKFHPESNKMNTYLPTTEIVIIIKKFNGQNVITLTKADCELDYGNYYIETDVITLEKDSNLLNAGSNAHFINVFLDEEKKQVDKATDIVVSSAPQKDESKLIDENYAMQTDAIEIECYHCRRKNFVNDGSNYRCEFCHKDLFG